MRGKMTKDIIVNIEGRQLDSDEMVMIFKADGVYHLQRQKHYIQYDEPTETEGAVIKNMIKISPNRIEITKKGAASSQMYFDIDQNTEAIYQTPYGNLCFQVKTSGITVEETENSILVKLEYTLYSEGSHLSDHRTVIMIQAKPSTYHLR
jgi:uncharacterized beta-barrel protein YwiB (DUF1934 family)